jgi:hypothetical protein
MSQCLPYHILLTEVVVYQVQIHTDRAHSFVIEELFTDFDKEGV